MSTAIEAGEYDDFQNFAINYEGEEPFLILFEYYQTHGGVIEDINPGFQHEYMADYYIQYISMGLKKLHPVLSSQGFVNYKTGSYVYDETWSWDNFFNYLAWEGLQGTDTFNDKIRDSGKIDYYNFYRQEANMESQSNRCN